MKKYCIITLFLCLIALLYGCGDNLTGKSTETPSPLTYSYVGHRAFTDISPVDLSSSSIAFCEFAGRLTLAYIDTSRNVIVYTFNGSEWEKLNGGPISTGRLTCYEFNELSMTVINDELFIGFSEFDATDSNYINYVVKRYSGNQWVDAGGVVTSIKADILMIAAKIASNDGKLYVAYAHQTSNISMNESKLKVLIDNSWQEVSSNPFSENHAVSLDFIFDDDIPFVAHSFGFMGIGIKSLVENGWNNELDTLQLMGYDLSIMKENGALYLSYSKYVPTDANDRIESYGRINGNWEELDIVAPTGTIRRTLLFSYNGVPHLAYIHEMDDNASVSIAVLNGKKFKGIFEQSFPIKTGCYNHCLFFRDGCLYVGFYDYENNNRVSVIQISMN